MAKDDYGTSPFSPRAAEAEAGTDQATIAYQVGTLEDKVQDLENRRIQIETDVFGLFETVSAAPTGTPQTVYDQVKIYVNSTTYRLYWYDTVGHVWHYVTATA
jgi:hypothetical protein